MDIIAVVGDDVRIVPIEREPEDTTLAQLLVDVRDERGVLHVTNLGLPHGEVPREVNELAAHHHQVAVLPSLFCTRTFSL